MAVTLNHDMKPTLHSDDVARQRFVSGLRMFVLNDLAADMRRAYEARARPAFIRNHGQEPADSAQVHAAMRPDMSFKVYSALRVNAQKMVWDSVLPVVERERETLNAKAETASQGRVQLDPQLAVPRNVSAIDVHFMPGSYVGKNGDSDVAPGAIYDQGLAVFSMGLMGQNLDDIGLSMSRYVSRKFPRFTPRKILDLGCTIGHNTLPWKQTYPDAEITGIDVTGSCLKYAAARARMQGVDVCFRQMNAAKLDYPDASFDLVFSSMFLHELPRQTLARVFAEIHRVLRSGGLMLHMELPPNSQTGAFEGFYLDWDCYYNVEPYYKAYRDRSPPEVCAQAGFKPQDYFQFVVPSIGGYGAAAVDEAIRAESGAVDRETTGRLAAGIQWFGYGAWRERAA
ncbi:MAG: class I SAM-dependent methyltransferase [Steroidobacteraceae bacterium]